MLKWPGLSLGFLIAGILSAAPAGAAPLSSQTVLPRQAPNGAAPDTARLIASLTQLGVPPGDLSRNLSYLSSDELRQLSVSLDTIMTGAGEEGKKAAGVAIAIVVVLALFTGIYLFSNN
jgi:hypothetical protein